MIAVDTNILVYAHREDSPWHERAYAKVCELAEGRSPWAIPWPCIHEFYSVVTHPRIYRPPSSSEQAAMQIEVWARSPGLVCIGEGPAYLQRFLTTIRTSQIAGSRVHDARISAICGQHGVRALWTADRDFSRFDNVEVVNPLLGAPSRS